MPIDAIDRPRHQRRPRPRYRHFPAFVIALRAVLAPMAHAEVDEHYVESFYVVNAEPDMPLSTLISQASYIKFDGVTYHGSATPSIRSKLFWNVDDATGMCRMTRVVVTLRIDVRLPRLFDASDAQRAAFERFMAPLRVHEQGHVDLYRANAARMVREQEAVPPMPSCEDLQKAAINRGEEVLREGRAADVRYDAETKHGLNQRTD